MYTNLANVWGGKGGDWEGPKDTQDTNDRNEIQKYKCNVQNESPQILTILGRDQEIHFVSSLIRPHLDV